MAFSPIPGLTLPKTGTSLVPVNTKVAAPKTARTVTTPTKTTVVQPPPAAPNYATLMAQAATQASKLAASQIAAQVKAITDQQTQLHATASAQAAEINKASLAAAQFLSGLGDMTKSDYTAAVQNLAGMTGGYTGALRDTAQQAADAAQAQLSSIPGSEQTIQNRGDDLANLVYGVSGQIPANALAVQGLGATELARAVPQQELSYGQQQAIGQLGEGNKAADALNSQIATIRATLPTTTSTYLSQFEKSAQDQITNARNARTDALQAKNIGSEIATRKQTAKQRAADAAAKLVPVLDVGRSRLTGVMTSQFGKPITKTVKGVQYLQALPGFHFDSRGNSVADPKPLTLDQQSARAAEWTGKLHYRADWQGNPLHGKITPVGGWVVSPDGQSAVPPTKPGKAFVPKPIEVDNKYAFVGQDNAIHFFKNASDGTIPWPEKGATLKLFNSGGFAAIFDPATRTTYFATDNNGTKLPWGTPKAPPTGHFAGRYPAADGFYHVYNSTTGEDRSLGTRVSAKDAAAGSWVKVEDPVTHQISFYNPVTQVTQDTPFKGAAKTASTGTWQTLPPDQHGNVYRINSKTNERQLIPGYHPPASGAVGTYSNLRVGNTLWRINSVTNKVVKTNLPWPTSAHGALSAEAVQSYTDRINAQLTAMENGIPADPNKGTPAHPAVTSRSEAIGRLDHAGYMTKALRPLAMAILNEYYPLAGATGKNWFRVPANLGR